jgi:hypothetical protein
LKTPSGFARIESLWSITFPPAFQFLIILTTPLIFSDYFPIFNSLSFQSLIFNLSHLILPFPKISMELFASLFSSVFLHPIWIYITSIACIILVVMITLTTVAGFVRRRGLDPRTAVPHLDEYPMITVVMCCKGVHDRSLSNFKRNLAMEYPGPVEFVFVAES